MSPPRRVVWVVPCFDEASRLRDSELLRLARSEGASLLLVDDGSRDATLSRLRAIAAAEPGRVAVLALERNRGKAEAVRLGMRRALEDGAPVVGYADADLATPVDELVRLATALDVESADAVLGSRVNLLGAHIERDPRRHYLGRIFATAASLVLRIAIYDTQCGAKLFRRSRALEAAVAEPFLSRWVFDVELLGRVLAASDDRYRIVEVPLRAWKDVSGSKIRPADFARAALDLTRIESDLARRRNERATRGARRARD